jgi:RCC1 and BTB domain-containing protein
VGNSSNQPTPIRVTSLQGQVVTQIACGYAHALALTKAGELYSWGSNSYGQLGTGTKINAVSPNRVAEDLGKFVEIAACHYSHVSAAVKLTGLLYMWGQCRGQPILSPMETKFDNLDDVFACFASPASMWRPLVIDFVHSNSLAADMKNAFNDQANNMAQNRLDRWPVFSLLDSAFVLKIKIACVFGGAGNEAIVVTEDDEVYSLGSNCSNCLGVGEGNGGLQPRRIDPLVGKKLCSFAFGSGPHVLAINSQGELFSWGHNGYGQLGVGNQFGVTPIQVSLGISNVKVIQVACGSHHSLALTSDGDVFAWGYSNCGQVGLGITTNQTTPRRVQTNIGGKFCVKIACGQTSSMALTQTGELYSWGYNGNGQLGVGNSSNQPTPIRVTSLQGQVVTQIACGYAHALALTKAGELYSWGSNSYGQLGTGTKINAVSPNRVAEDLGKFVEIAACHYSHVSAAVKLTGLLYMWGQCRGQPILSPMETKFDNLDDVFACFASPASMWRPLVIDFVHSNSLAADMKNAFNDQESSDLTIMVEDKPIYVHKAVLKIR